MDRDALKRIASALERLTPPSPEKTDWLAHPAYVWDGAEARPIHEIQTVGLEILRGIDAQKGAVLENLTRLANGAATHDMLLWGARGMGKSALIRACVNQLVKEHAGRLALVQIGANALHQTSALMELLAHIDRSFLLYIDDLGFDAGNKQDSLALRSVIEGGASLRPHNVRIAVTSNRRAIVERDQDENRPLNERDERDNALALADRFGLKLAFHPCDQDTYLEIVQAYLEPLNLDFETKEACNWAITQGNRSGRTAYQFATELAGRAGLKL